MPERVRRVGLIVNPVAGLGGAAGLKGSDLPNVVELTAGREAIAARRAAEAMTVLAGHPSPPIIVTAKGDMGESAARAAGLDVDTVDFPLRWPSTAADTVQSAKAIAASGVEILLFVGGDGTAVDILGAVGESIAVLGIPAGVKMHSGVFALSPRAGGALAKTFLDGSKPALVTGEVLDIDEALARTGRINPRLHGSLRIPGNARLVQAAKGRAAIPDRMQVDMLAASVHHLMEPDVTYVFGPGSTTAKALESLGLESTVLGVDVVRNGEVIAHDVDDRRLVSALEGDFRIVISPIGGQGFVFGRGNQQISAEVLAHAGRERIIVIATEDKLVELGGLPLKVDSGDARVDASIAGGGYIKVLTGPDAWMVYPIEAVP